jgi:hypothetical protein
MVNVAYQYLDLVPKGRDEGDRPPYWSVVGTNTMSERAFRVWTLRLHRSRVQALVARCRQLLRKSGPEAPGLRLRSTRGRGRDRRRGLGAFVCRGDMLEAETRGLGVKIVRDSGGAGAHPTNSTHHRNRGSRRANQRACCVSTSHNHSMLAILDIGGVLALEFALSFSYRTSS